MIWHTTLCYPHPKKSSSEKSMEGIVGNRIFLHKLSDLVLSWYKWEFLPLAHIFLMWSPVTMQFGDITGVQLCWKSISLGWALRAHSLVSLPVSSSATCLQLSLCPLTFLLLITPISAMMNFYDFETMSPYKLYINCFSQCCFYQSNIKGTHIGWEHHISIRIHKHDGTCLQSQHSRVWGRKIEYEASLDI